MPIIFYIFVYLHTTHYVYCNPGLPFVVDIFSPLQSKYIVRLYY